MRGLELLKTTVLLLLPPLLMVLSFLLSRSIVKERMVSEEERRLYKYISEVREVPEIPEPPTLEVPSFVKDPFAIVKRVMAVVKERKEGKTVIEKRPPEWDLKLVVVSRKKRLAVLNGITVKEGDTIDEYLVREIGENYVVLQKGDDKRKVFIKTGG